MRHFFTSPQTCKWVVNQLDASRIFMYSMCQLMPTGLYTRYEIKEVLQRFERKQNYARGFEKRVSTNQTRVWSREILHHRNSEQDWLFHCRRSLLALQRRAWRRGLILSLLSLPRTTVFAKKETLNAERKGNYWTKCKIITSIMLQFCGKTGRRVSSIYGTDASVKQHLRVSLPSRRTWREEQ